MNFCRGEFLDIETEDVAYNRINLALARGAKRPESGRERAQVADFQ
jgi:hypothetical protein